jgi:hypothetical protein
MTTANKLLCGHLFHVHCLRSWLERQHTCPTCRAPIIPPDNGRAASARQHGAQPGVPFGELPSAVLIFSWIWLQSGAAFFPYREAADDALPYSSYPAALLRPSDRSTRGNMQKRDTATRQVKSKQTLLSLACC